MYHFSGSEQPERVQDATRSATGRWHDVFVYGTRKGRMWRHVFMINNTIVNCHHLYHYDRNFTSITYSIFIITLNVPFASVSSSSSRRHHMSSSSSSSSSSSRCHPFSPSCLLLFQRDGPHHKAIILQWYMHGCEYSIKCRWTTAWSFIKQSKTLYRIYLISLDSKDLDVAPENSRSKKNHENHENDNYKTSTRKPHW